MAAFIWFAGDLQKPHGATTYVMISPDSNSIKKYTVEFLSNYKVCKLLPLFLTLFFPMLTSDTPDICSSDVFKWVKRDHWDEKWLDKVKARSTSCHHVKVACSRLQSLAIGSSFVVSVPVLVPFLIL